MRRGWRLGSVWAALLLTLGFAASASARTFTGTLTVTAVSAPASTNDLVTVAAVATISQSCDPAGPTYESCGYYPIVTTTSAAQGCTATITGSSWVGPLLGPNDGPGDKQLTPTWTEWPSIQAGQKRACLYVPLGAAGGDVLVAETLYEVPTAPAALRAPVRKTPVPATRQPSVARPISLTRARTELVEILATEFDGFVRHALRRDCYRLTETTVRCRVRWDYRGRWRYQGVVDLRSDPEGAEFASWTHSIRRQRIRVARPVPKRRLSQPATPRCNPNYSGVCLPLTGDMDCPDIPAQAFPVVGDDPFGLDADRDGVACES